MGIIADRIRSVVADMKREDEIRAAKIRDTLDRIHRLTNELADLEQADAPGSD